MGRTAPAKLRRLSQMKHIFQHPPAQKGERRYWRSLDELADSPEVQQWIQREFPEGAAELELDGLGRRKFLGILGASIALAGFTGCRRPESYLVPLNATPEFAVPSKILRYATSFPAVGHHVPAVARVFNGRPIFIEGNPAHPMSQGKIDVHTQAEVLSLYDPDRSRVTKVLTNGRHMPATALLRDQKIDELRVRIEQNGGARTAVIALPSTSPSFNRLKKKFLAKYRFAKWCDYDPLYSDRPSQIFASLINRPFARPFYDFSRDNATVILSLGSDFLGTESTLHNTASFTNGRRVHQPGDKMNRLYAVETSYSITGQMADHRLRITSTQLPAFASAFAAACIKNGLQNDALSQVLRFANSQPPAGIDVKWLEECAKDLVAHRGHAVVVPGANQPEIVHLIAHALNDALGAFGKALKSVDFPVSNGNCSLSQVASALQAGEVDTVVVIGGNPAYNAPAELMLENLLDHCELVVRLGYYEDETTAVSDVHIPASHTLEGWGDGLAEDGSHTSVQPMILPIFESLTDTEFLYRLIEAPLAGSPQLDSRLIARETFRELFEPTSDEFAFETAWQVFLRDGFRAGSQKVSTDIQLNSGTLAQMLTSEEIPSAIPSAESLEVNFAVDYSLLDGRYINNGWLQELPDPLTKITWENAALISPRTARELGVTTRSIKGIVTGDVLELNFPDYSLPLQVPVYVLPGHADNSITLPLGYGRSIVGQVGQGSGFNAYAFRTSKHPWRVNGVRARATGRKHGFACTQEHYNMEGRALQRELPLKMFNEDPSIVKKMGMDSHVPPTVNFYTPPPLDAPHQWAMSIDMSTCTGCNACVIACQAENNIPIVGKEQVQRGREMAWIRVDRYFLAEDPHKDYVQDAGEFPENPMVIMQPLTCMHCENAPCETVCPVNATVHSEDGLNVMAYNRCIGTRYCANNCPYKVRRFNYFDYNKRNVLKRHQGPFGEFGNLYAGPFGEKNDPLPELQKNPNVTVRMRGVMEKCTFCVQRIEEAKIDMLVKARDSKPQIIPDGYFQVACQQACPADAIVFGNISDPESRVSKLKQLGHDYQMLQYLNIRPRVSYLARVRNPNPAMPGAEFIGMSSLAVSHVGHHGDDKGMHHDAQHSTEHHSEPSQVH